LSTTFGFTESLLVISWPSNASITGFSFLPFQGRAKSAALFLMQEKLFITPEREAFISDRPSSATRAPLI
jgi:hypothetical protein